MNQYTPRNCMPSKYTAANNSGFVRCCLVTIQKTEKLEVPVLLHRPDFSITMKRRF